MKCFQNLVWITCQLYINNFDQNHVYRVFILEFSLNYTKKQCFVLLINIRVPCFIRDLL